MRSWLVRLGIVFAVCLPLLASAGVPPEPGKGVSEKTLFPWASFGEGLPALKSVVGIEPGERPVTHGELMAYLRALTAASPRATLIPYAKSHEGRDLVYLAISDPETIRNLDAFQKAHADRVDPRRRSTAAVRKAVAQAKSVAWMAYGIHGDELSSVDAAAAVSYWLIAGEDDRAKRLRQELVILVDPIENPDGRDRFLAQTRAFAHATPNPDVEDLSHRTVWPWGRGNHYLFDLNRDWFSLVHPESTRSEVIASWNPQLMVDSHEMGSSDTYLFSPPRHPFNPYLPPSHLARWADEFAKDQAAALDGRGYAYYTREWNEEFFPGYGSSWASYLGAVGILYEMSGTEGTVVRKRSGTLRTYAQAVEHQVTSSVSNLETLAAHRAEILRDFVEDRRTAVDRGRKGPVGAWFLPESRHPERTRALVRTLMRQSIEVYRNDGRASTSGLRDAYTGQSVKGTWPDTVWMIPLDQPAGPLVRQLLDPHIPMQASFLREEREFLERGKGTRLYETTAWSMPLSYGIDAWWARRRPARGWKRATSVPEQSGRLIPAKKRAFAYIIDGTSDASVPALASLFQRGVRVQIADEAFRIGGQDYGHGALLIVREGNPVDIETQLAAIAVQHKIDVRAVDTSKAESGPDLGGRHFHTLREPRIGILTGWPISPPSYGALWRMLDLDVQMRFTAIDVGRFASVDLNRYNVLVFPPTWGSYSSMLGEPGLENLMTWVKGGGTVVGIGAGASFLADKETELTKARLRSQALEAFPPAVLSVTMDEVHAAGPPRASGVRVASANGKDDEPPVYAVKNTRRKSPYDVAPIIGPGARPFAAGFDAGTPLGQDPVPLTEWVKADLAPGKSEPEEEDLTRADARLRRFSPQGVYLRVELDPELWLAWGLPKEMPVLVRSRDTLVAEPPVQVPARFASLDDLHLGGLLWPEAAGRIGETAYLTQESVGRGQVILFLNEPEFRGWTLASRRLVLNAMLLGPGLGTSWSAPW